MLQRPSSGVSILADLDITRAIHLVDGLERARSELHADMLLEGVGEEAAVVDVGEPCAAGLVLGGRYAVPVLLRLPVEEAQLGAPEWGADDIAEQ